MTDSLEKYHNYGANLEKYLRTATFPLAIKLIKNESEISKDFKRAHNNLDLEMFVCQNFKMARTYGWTMAITDEDCSCKVARTVYNWDEVTPESIEFGNQFSIGLYSSDQKVAEKWTKHLHFLPKRYKGIIISPLTRSKIVPDVILVFCNPAQAMRLIQAQLYNEGGVLEFTAAGRAGSCHEGVIKTFLTNKPQLVILGNGDRVWGGAQDDEILFSIPVSSIKSIIDGLVATHTAGLRYPIPTYMNYKPGFQIKFKKKALKRSGGTLVKND
jgi:uncharacterized protein (DUF169 family)